MLNVPLLAVIHVVPSLVKHGDVVVADTCTGPAKVESDVVETVKVPAVDMLVPMVVEAYTAPLMDMTENAIAMTVSTRLDNFMVKLVS